MLTELSPGLIVDGADGAPRLLAGRSRSDGKLRFPPPSGDEAADYDIIELSPDGELWSCTVQRYRPNAPPYSLDDAANFQPFAVGYVNVGGEILIEARLVGRAADGFEIGMQMRLQRIELPILERGKLSFFAFAPSEMIS